MAKRSWTKQLVITAIRDYHQQGIPIGKIWKQDHTLRNAAVNFFGKWRNALVAAGLQSPREQWTRDRVIQEMQARYHATNDHRKDLGRLGAAAGRYFGSWRTAMRSAGLPTNKLRPPKRHWTNPEVLAAIQLRHEQGLSLTAVWRDDLPLYSIAKRQYGSWRGALDAAGLAPPSLKTWTREEILSEIQARREQGLPLAGLERLATRLYYSAKRIFGSWLKALREAGIEVPPRRRWNRSAIIAAIRLRHQNALSLAGVWREDRPLFCAAVKHFGNWQNAKQAAGIEYKSRRKWSAELVLDELKAWYSQEQRLTRPDPALVAAANRFFGRLCDAWTAAGIHPPSRKWTKERIVEEIQNRYVRGLPLQYAGFRDSNLASAAKRHFGNWRAAVEAAGLLSKMPSRLPPRDWTPQGVLEAIRAQNRGKAVATCKRESDLCSVVRRHFGTWRKAVLAAGLQPSRQVWSPQAVIREILARRKQGLTLSSAIHREDCRLSGAAIRYFGSWRKALLAAGIDPATVISESRKPKKGAVA